MGCEVISKPNLAGAIAATAGSLAVYLNFGQTLPALQEAVLIDAVRPQLIAALERETVGKLNDELAAFEKEHRVVLVANGALPA